MRPLALVLLALVLVGCAAPNKAPDEGTPPPSGLPPLASIRSDRFLVDMDALTSGHPYLGQRSAAPHAGAHVEFDNSAGAWPKDGTGPDAYPAIYAVADGVVSRVERSFKVGANDRYGLSLDVARENGTTWAFDYSIEPFVPEPSPGYYESFLLVKEGDHVKKGDVVARMFLPRLQSGPHVHFHLRPSTGSGTTFAAPAIFSPGVIQQFRDRWGAQGGDPSAQAAACIGWKLAAQENPYGTGAVDCL